MSQSTSRRATAVLLTALCAGAALPAAASAKAQDLKVMTRNVYLGADLIPLAAAPDQAAFETAAAQRFQTVLNNDFPTRAKALAAEIRKAKPDIIGVQEAAIWRRGADGVKDGATTPATQVIYDSSEELRRRSRPAPTRRSWGATGSTSRRRPPSTTTSASPSATSSSSARARS